MGIALRPIRREATEVLMVRITVDPRQSQWRRLTREVFEWPQPEFHFMGLTVLLYGVTISTYGANHKHNVRCTIGDMLHTHRLFANDDANMICFEPSNLHFRAEPLRTKLRPGP
jgi:hypothetical protein